MRRNSERMKRNYLISIASASTTRKGLSLLVFLNLLAINLYSQKRFAYKADVETVDSTGFYRIILSPEVLSKCSQDLRDIRIYDPEKKEVPYVINHSEPATQNDFIPFVIESKLVAGDKRMHIRLKNPGRNISQLVLQVQNSYSSRVVNINGSNDGINWFSIRDNVQINTSGNDSTGFFYFVIDLPLSKTNYFDITFTDKNLLPVNILAAGIFNQHQIPQQYDTIPARSITQKDSSNKRSYIDIRWNMPYPFKFIIPDITAPSYYRRTATIDSRTVQRQIQVLQSGSANRLDANTSDSNILLEIMNDDNPSLELKTVSGLVQRHTLYAMLTKGEAYQIFFGDSLAGPPNYDLVYFNDRMRDDAPELKISTIRANDAIVQTQSENSFNKAGLWLIMGGVLLVLLFFTFKLTASIQKKQ